MLKNYLKTAFRSLWRHKFLSGINILGMATGIACCLLIAVYIFHETGYDSFHSKANRIVRATTEFAYNGKVTKVAVSANKVFPEFKRVFPEVENGLRLYPVSAVIKYNDKIFEEKGFVYADSTLFSIFSFPLLAGSTDNALNKPNQAVLTISAAKKYFGNEPAIGKTITVNNDKEFTVTGIVQDVPANSQIKFDILASWYSLTDPLYQEERWSDANYYTYLLLKKPGLHKALEEKIPVYFKSQNKNNDAAGKNYMTVHVQPLEDVHLRALVEGGFEPGGDYRYIYIFSIIALLILAIACANYVNLTTARAAERAREVGMRKVAGASRSQLFSQFMGESVFTVFVALLIGIILIAFLLPAFNAVSGKQFELNDLLSVPLLITACIFLLVISLLGGLYPAIILSAFKPVKVLKGSFKAGPSGTWLRKVLTMVQFVISVTLIISTLVIHYQLRFIREKKLGYDNDHVLVLRSDKFVLEKISAIKSEFLRNPAVQGVTTCNQTPTFVPGQYNLSLQNKEILITGIRVDKDFIKTLDLNIQHGTDFTQAEEAAAFAGTDTVQRPVILNESAATSLGWTAASAVGKTLQLQGRNSIVKAVVSDFHFSSMHQAIGPFVIFLSNNTRNILAKLSANKLPETLTFLQNKWKTLAPHRPFEYEFLDQQFDKLYTAETRTGKIFYAFACLAIGLACLGLLGLATFTAQQRTKEIGVRKVLGASVAGIIVLLSKDFLKPVGLSVFVAFPLSWWAMNKWLQDFVYRINVSAWFFVIAGVIAAVIALATISFQAIKAAIANPVKSLRTE